MYKLSVFFFFQVFHASQSYIYREPNSFPIHCVAIHDSSAFFWPYTASIIHLPYGIISFSQIISQSCFHSVTSWDVFFFFLVFFSCNLSLLPWNDFITQPSEIPQPPSFVLFLLFYNDMPINFLFLFLPSPPWFPILYQLRQLFPSYFSPFPTTNLLSMLSNLEKRELFPANCIAPKYVSFFFLTFSFWYTRTIFICFVLIFYYDLTVNFLFISAPSCFLILCQLRNLFLSSFLLS